MFSGAILKLNAWCNLNCTYCYMFNQGDSTYSRVPQEMSLETARTSVRRIIEHRAGSGSTSKFDVTLHGGEPSLWPVEALDSLLRFARDESERAGVDLRITMQTNALRLSPDLLEVLAAHELTVGVSLDGPPAFNDARRKTRSGRGSYSQVIENAHRLADYPTGSLLGGFLCVADPTIPPDEFVDWASGLPVRRLDVLWPMDFNYEHPPWQDVGLDAYLKVPTYGRWFASLFEEWWARDDPDLYIRSFRQLVELWLGSRRHTDALANDHLNLVVVNTDGEIEYPDYFRVLTDGACRSGMNVQTHSLDQAQTDPIFNYCENLGLALPSECVDCPVVSVCGGGFLPGRLRKGELTPRYKSVLCFDQYLFFTRARALFEQSLVGAGAAS